MAYQPPKQPMEREVFYCAVQYSKLITVISESISSDLEMDSRRMSRPRQIKFEEGWSNIQKGITKLIRILEGEPEPTFYFSECFKLYTIIYDMCVQRSDYSQQLYEKYRKVIEDYTIQTVLPSLREKHDEDMLRELVKRWNNHKIMVKWLSKFFVYIDRHLVRRSKIPIPSLDEVGLTCFLDLVGDEYSYSSLFFNAANVFVTIHANYLLQVYCEMQSTAKEVVIALVEECLKMERERVTHYLHSITEPKLVEKIQNELLVMVTKNRLENEHSGFSALLRDDKHITEEGNALIKQADDKTTNQLLIELHNKFIVYVIECFQNHTLFHKFL
ncbi:Hypothetical protein [Arabidopsis thaliana]|nr:Hypothetical protein [Arabidopsis thaliana]